MEMKLSEIASKINCKFVGNGDLLIKGICNMDDVEKNYLAICVAKKDFIPVQLREKKNKDIGLFSNHNIDGFDCILFPPLKDIHKKHNELLDIFHVKENFNTDIHKTAIIEDGSAIGENTSIGAYTVISKNVTIGNNTVIFPNVTIYPDVIIGNNCTIHSGVVLRSGVEIGNNVEIDNNASIGITGFDRGFVKGNLELSFPLVGKIIIEDDVFIGANTLLAKNEVGNLKIGKGTKIDGQVYVSRLTKIGKYCRVAGQAAIGDSVKIGNEVSIGPQSGIYDNITIGNNAFIVSTSGVLKSVPDRVKVCGTPAVEVKKWLKIQAIIRNLPEIISNLKIKNR